MARYRAEMNNVKDAERMAAFEHLFNVQPSEAVRVYADIATLSSNPQVQRLLQEWNCSDILVQKRNIPASDDDAHPP